MIMLTGMVALSQEPLSEGAAASNPSEARTAEVADGDEAEEGAANRPDELRLNDLLELKKLTEAAASAADSLANSATKVAAIDDAVKGLTGGGDSATKLVNILSDSARDESSSTTLRIKSIQFLVATAATIGQEGASRGDLEKRLNTIKMAVENPGGGITVAREVRSELEEKLTSLGSGPFGNALDAIAAAYGAVESLGGQIKRYEDGWKKEFDRTVPIPTQPETLRDRIDQLGKDISERGENATNTLLDLVLSGYSVSGDLPTPTAVRLSRVAFDSLSAHPGTFYNQLADFIKGEPIEVVELKRKSVDAAARIGTDDARRIGTQALIRSLFEPALKDSDRRVQVIGADGVLAMVTAEEIDKRASLIGDVERLLGLESAADTVVRSKLITALGIVAENINLKPMSRTGVGEPASSSGQAN